MCIETAGTLFKILSHVHEENRVISVHERKILVLVLVISWFLTLLEL
jgi:hypothetical protein